MKKGFMSILNHDLFTLMLFQTCTDLLSSMEHKRRFFCTMLQPKKF